MLRLEQLPPGRRARVLCLTERGGMRRRLMDLGFTAGARVECLLEAPGKGMRAYRVRRSLIALRRKDAGHVMVEEEQHE